MWKEGAVAAVRPFVFLSVFMFRVRLVIKSCCASLHSGAFSLSLSRLLMQDRMSFSFSSHAKYK